VIRHSVLFRFSPETTPEQIDAMTAGLSTLPDLLPQIVRYQLGPDLGENADNWHYAIVADFDDLDAWRAYSTDPRHLDLIARLVRPIVADRAAVQYEI
jgi:hypothetical protein